SVNKLLVILECFRLVVDEPLIPGGCPLMNSAIESDDAHPLLKERVQIAMGRLLNRVETIITEGIKANELKQGIDPHVVATFLVASVEGGIMLSKLYDDKERIYTVVAQMQQYVRQLAK
ncbi:MAG TPA: hypothetical protein V6C72_17670, partial [Chroococcales cyanobacterium]